VNDDTIECLKKLLATTLEERTRRSIMAPSIEESKAGATNHDGSAKERKRKRRWGNAAENTATATVTTPATALPPAPSGPVDSKAKALALKASIAARLAALKSKTAAAAGTTLASSAGTKRPLPPPPTAASSSALPSTATAPPVTKRAKHYELDMTVTGPTFKSSSAVLKPKVNPYLAHLQEPSETDDANNKEGNNSTKDGQENIPNVAKFDPSESKYVDARLEATGHDGAGKRHRRRELKFVEPGTFVNIAERKRQRAANAESAGFASGRKAGQYFRSATMGSSGGGDGNYYGTTEVVDDIEDKGVLAPRAEIGNATLDGKAENANNSLRAMPLVVEWWDMELLPSKLKKQVASFEGNALSKATQSQMQQFSASTKEENTKAEGETSTETEAVAKVDKAQELRAKCAEQSSLSYSKTASLIQHIVPIQAPGEAGKKPVEPVLYMTKKEQKRARKRRREQKQRELQDMQAAGLIEAPEPRLTLQNFIRVMGDQAYLDPSQMERKVAEQVQKRQKAHLERNEAKKLTKEQKSEKLRSRVEKDATPSSNATGAIHVALFYVKNASHPYHRTILDLNAQQRSITGGVLQCDVPNVSCVICEGGPKAIKQYQRLLLVRMKWKGPDEGDDDEESEDEELNEAPLGEDAPPKKVKHKFDKENRCDLVWTGLATKRQFKSFVFQHCETSAQARKVLKSKGVGQYWDQILAHVKGSGDAMHLKLVESDSENEDEAAPMDTT